MVLDRSEAGGLGEQLRLVSAHPGYLGHRIDRVDWTPGAPINGENVGKIPLQIADRLVAADIRPRHQLGDWAPMLVIGQERVESRTDRQAVRPTSAAGERAGKLAEHIQRSEQDLFGILFGPPGVRRVQGIFARRRAERPPVRLISDRPDPGGADIDPNPQRFFHRSTYARHSWQPSQGPDATVWRCVSSPAFSDDRRRTVSRSRPPHSNVDARY